MDEMPDISGAGPLWVAKAERFSGRPRFVWFREIDPPYRRGRGVQAFGVAFGVCRRRGGSDLDALDGHDLEVDVEEIRDWGDPVWEELQPIEAGMRTVPYEPRDGEPIDAPS